MRRGEVCHAEEEASGPDQGGVPRGGEQQPIMDPPLPAGEARLGGHGHGQVYCGQHLVHMNVGVRIEPLP